MLSWAEIFEHFLEQYRRDDGSKWTGAALERATNGVVRRNYVSKLRAGFVNDPSFTKVDALSKAMGIPLEAWSEAASSSILDEEHT